jgi:hypothetical protein
MMKLIVPEELAGVGKEQNFRVEAVDKPSGRTMYYYSSIVERYEKAG